MRWNIVLLNAPINKYTEACEHQQLSTSIANGGLKRAASGYSASNRIGVIGQGLPDPRPGCRPIWEPPTFGYTYFEKILEAQKKFAMGEGSQDIALGTDVMDHYVEIQISLMYGDWVSEQVHKYEDGRGAMFFKNPDDAVQKDIREIYRNSAAARHGRDWFDGGRLYNEFSRYLRLMSRTTPSKFEVTVDRKTNGVADFGKEGRQTLANVKYSNYARYNYPYTPILN